MEEEFSNMEVLKDNDDVLEDDNINEEENKIVEPMAGMKFVDTDTMFDFYKNYGKLSGFPVCKKTRKKGDDGTVKYVTFVCGRSGKPGNTSANSLKPYPSTWIGCKARIAGCLDLDGNYRMNSVILDHNHGLSPKKSRFYRCYRSINPHAKRQIEINDMAGVRVNKSYNSLVVGAGGHENVGCSQKDVRNEVDKQRRLRLGEGDASAVLNYFSKMQEQNTGFFFRIDMDEDDRLKNVFWADGRSREAYKEFGEVITFDTTYLTNKYDMPFAPFVGVNHHGQSTLFGCGLISCEDAPTFCWLFNTWLECMSGQAPNAIITDQDKAMKKAIEIVFPNARHRWCLWHIMNKFSQKLRGYERYHSISFHLQAAVYDSQRPIEFEQSWNAIIDKYSLHENDWLSDLYDERHRWIPCFVKHLFWAGMSTTQRNESINAFFDGYVHAKTTLKQFVEQYDNALRSKVEKEDETDHKSFASVIPCVTTYEMEKQVQDIYTMSKFQEFQAELTGQMYCFLTLVKEDLLVSEYEVREDVVVGEVKKRIIFTISFSRDECEVECSCHRFEFKGILCRHALNVLIRNDVVLIPEKYILRRWRKDVRRFHTRIKIPYAGWALTTEQILYDRMCNAFTKVADLAALDGEVCNDVIKWIDDTFSELSSFMKLRCASNLPTPMPTPTPKSTPNSTVQPITSNNTIDNIRKESQNILDPKVIRKKGRPRLRRLKKIMHKQQKSVASENMQDHQTGGPFPSEVPEANKKLKRKRQAQNNGPTSKNGQDCETNIPFKSQKRLEEDVFRTQESIHLGNNHFEMKWFQNTGDNNFGANSNQYLTPERLTMSANGGKYITHERLAVNTSSSHYPTMGLHNTNMGLLWGFTPGVHPVFAGNQFMDPQNQYVNLGHDMHVMPSLGITQPQIVRDAKSVVDTMLGD